MPADPGLPAAVRSMAELHRSEPVRQVSEVQELAAVQVVRLRVDPAPPALELRPEPGTSSAEAAEVRRWTRTRAVSGSRPKVTRLRVRDRRVLVGRAAEADSTDQLQEWELPEEVVRALVRPVPVQAASAVWDSVTVDLVCRARAQGQGILVRVMAAGFLVRRDKVRAK